MELRPSHRPPPRVRQRGQATVETVGIVVAIAILLAATGAWLSGGISLPRPPDLIGTIARVLGAGAPDRAAGPRAGIDVPGSGGFVRADHASILPPGADPLIGSALRRIGGQVRDGTAVLATGAWSGLGFSGELREAFVRGFEERARERAEELLLDPFGLVRAARDLVLHPEPGSAAIGDVRLLGGYARSLLRMSFRRAALRVSRDLGARAADEAIAYLLRGGVRAASRRVARAPDPRGEGSGDRGLGARQVMR